MTSLTKLWVVVSLIRSGAACGAAPLPSNIVTAILVWCLPDLVLAGACLARAAFMVQLFSCPNGGSIRNFNWFRADQDGAGSVIRRPARPIKFLLPSGLAAE